MIKRLIVAVGALLLLLAEPIGSAAAPPLQYQGSVASPRSGSVVRGSVSVIGTANHPEFWKYEIRVVPGQNPGIGDDQWYRVIVREEPVLNGQLAVWDTSVLPDGLYTMRLRVVRLDGNWQDFDVLPLTVANSTPPTATLAPPTATSPPPPPPSPTTAVIASATPTVVLASPTPSPTATPAQSPTPLTLATLTPAGALPAPTTPLPATVPAEGIATLTPASVEASVEAEVPPAASATATPIVIEQPTILVPTAPGTDGLAAAPTAIGGAVAAVASPPATDTTIPALPDGFGSALDVGTLASACLTGAAFTVSIFFLVGLLYLLKSLVTIFR